MHSLKPSSSPDILFFLLHLCFVLGLTSPHITFPASFLPSLWWGRGGDSLIALLSVSLYFLGSYLLASLSSARRKVAVLIAGLVQKTLGNVALNWMESLLALNSVSPKRCWVTYCFLGWFLCVFFWSPAPLFYNPRLIKYLDTFPSRFKRLCWSSFNQ